MKLYELTEIYENIENLDDDVNVASALATVDGELEDKLCLLYTSPSPRD